MNKGDIVYYYEHWSKSIIKGRILKIYEVKDILVAKIESICFVSYDNRIIDNAYGVSNRPVLELFNSAKETYDFYYRKQKERIEEYSKEICTIEDLIKFPLEHCLFGEEYTDDAARQAYINMAKELLKIEL